MVDATVLIVGCGPTGLIAAHELLRRGMSCRLVDKRPAPQSSTRAFTVYARTMEMFDHMGMAYRVDEVRAVCPGNLFHLSEFCARGVPLQWGGQDGFGAARPLRGLRRLHKRQSKDCPDMCDSVG